ncbi:MAG: Gfo/Idh/MocA family oxidoreductase [Candidatus Thermoplasmatota archaeon]|jgi:predicted dehydrogenase|nr:Gfo/Idh/MocA family oxidoreductase [Candidatus Thermoplasmatota archaeon]
MKFAVIGLGNHAINRVMPAIILSGNSIDAVYSRNPVKAERIGRRFGSRAFDSYDQMLSSDCDAVYIASPNNLHYSNAMSALEHGKHVLLEKPMTLSYEDSKKLVSKAEEEHLSLAIGFHLRLHPAVEEIKKSILNGDLGDITTVDACWGGFSSSSRTPTEDSDNRWWGDEALVGGGSIMGTGVHVFDALNNIMGLHPDRISSFRDPRDSIIDATTSTILSYGATIAHAVSSRRMFLPDNSLRITGTEGSLICTGFFSTEIRSSLNVNGRIRRFRSGNIYRKEIDAFVDLVNGRKSLIATGVDGSVVVRMTELAIRSDMEDRSFPVDL